MSSRNDYLILYTSVDAYLPKLCASLSISFWSTAINTRVTPRLCCWCSNSASLDALESHLTPWHTKSASRIALSRLRPRGHRALDENGGDNLEDVV